MLCLRSDFVNYLNIEQAVGLRLLTIFLTGFSIEHWTCLLRLRMLSMCEEFIEHSTMSMLLNFVYLPFLSDGLKIQPWASFWGFVCYPFLFSVSKIEHWASFLFFLCSFQRSEWFLPNSHTHCLLYCFWETTGGLTFEFTCHAFFAFHLVRHEQLRIEHACNASSAVLFCFVCRTLLACERHERDWWCLQLLQILQWHAWRAMKCIFHGRAAIEASIACSSGLDICFLGQAATAAAMACSQGL